MREAATGTATKTNPGTSSHADGSNPKDSTDIENQGIDQSLQDDSKALQEQKQPYYDETVTDIEKKEDQKQPYNETVCKDGDEHASLSGKTTTESDKATAFSGKDYEEYLRIAGTNPDASDTGTATIDQPNRAAAMPQGDAPSVTSHSVMSRPGAYAHGGIQVVQEDTSVSDAEQDEDSSVSTDGTTVDDDAGLVEALPVSDIPSADMPQASPVEASTPTKRPEAEDKLSTTQKTLLLCLMVIFILVLCVVAVVISVQRGDSTSASEENSPGTGEEQGNRTVTAGAYLRQYLPEETLLDLDDASSPQLQAFEWLKEDPTLMEYSDARLLQRYALSTFYFSTNGPLWINSKDWLSYEIHECEWYFAGAFKIFGPELTATSPCVSSNATLALLLAEQDAPEDIYKRLWLRDNNVTGPLPRELYWLTALESIDFSRNNVTGQIDSDLIQEMQQLKHLSVPMNQLTGPFPTGIGMLSNTMEILYLSRNLMTGTIPQEVSYLQHSLKQFTLQGNGFTGTLPTDLGLLDQLNVLGIMDMPYITGTIPTELGMMTSLMYLYAFNSHLTGTIPTEVGLMSNLMWLHLQSNELSGSIPSTLGLLAPTLKELVLNDNQLSSSLPTELGLLGIQTFNVAQNDISGTIPSEYALLSVVTTFNVSGNVGLHGSIPNDLCFLEDIQLDFDCSEALCGCDCECLD